MLTGLDRRKDRRHACKLSIKIAGICRAGDLWNERWCHLLLVNFVPIDVPEVSVRHDFLRVGGTRSKSHFRLAGEQLLKNGDRVARHVNGVEWFVGENSIVDFVFVLSTERRLLEQHLIDQNTKRPPINGAAVLLV